MWKAAAVETLTTVELTTVSHPKEVVAEAAVVTQLPHFVSSFIGKKDTIGKRRDEKESVSIVSLVLFLDPPK